MPMTIRLEGQLYKTDPWVAELFTDILNAISGAATPVELHHALLRLCMRGRRPDLRRYFFWGFDRDRFWLRQRFDPKTGGTVSHKLLTVTAYDKTDISSQIN